MSIGAVVVARGGGLGGRSYHPDVGVPAGADDDHPMFDDAWVAAAPISERDIHTTRPPEPPVRPRTVAPPPEPMGQPVARPIRLGPSDGSRVAVMVALLAFILLAYGLPRDGGAGEEVAPDTGRTT